MEIEEKTKEEEQQPTQIEQILNLAREYREKAQEYQDKANTLEELAHNCPPQLLAIIAETTIDFQDGRWVLLPDTPPMVSRLLKAWKVLKGPNA